MFWMGAIRRVERQKDTGGWMTGSGEWSAKRRLIKVYTGEPARDKVPL